MINELTKEQMALFPKYVDKWLKIGLCTRPANKEKAETLINECYKVAGLTPPQKIIWCGSPLSAILTAKIVDKILSNPKFKSEIGRSVKASVGASVWDSVRDSVWDSVWDSVRDSVWDSVGASVRDSVGASVRDSVGASVRDSYWNQSVWNQHDAGWYAFCDFFYEALNLSKQVEKQIPLMRLAEEANWMYPYQNFCFVSEKPEIVALQNGRIHSTTGPSIKYRDGFEVYGLDGVRIPKEIHALTVNKNDPQAVMKIENTEHRLVAIKYFGVQNLLKELGGKVISEGELPNGGGTHGDGIYRLHSVQILNETHKLFEMPNPSEDKRHFEFVLPECETIEHADMWRRGYDNFKKYKPVSRRA